ncbi:MAG: transcription antitermination factor NusB [Rhodobacteraceae bacterium]|nr:transcription antitermination factor NusB [Paracoccaceae bacterium]
MTAQGTASFDAAPVSVSDDGDGGADGPRRTSPDKSSEDQPPHEKRREDKRLARSAARLAAVQALYRMEITGATWKETIGEFETHFIGAELEGAQYREADIALFRDLLRGVVERQTEIDKLTDAALVEKWPLGRVDPTLRAIFRCGGYELLARADVPYKVAINEYVDVAKAFFTGGQEARFANAVLDHMARRTREQADQAPGEAHSLGNDSTPEDSAE